VQLCAFQPRKVVFYSSSTDKSTCAVEGFLVKWCFSIFKLSLLFFAFLPSLFLKLFWQNDQHDSLESLQLVWISFAMHLWGLFWSLLFGIHKKIKFAISSLLFSFLFAGGFSLPLGAGGHFFKCFLNATFLISICVRGGSSLPKPVERASSFSFLDSWSGRSIFGGFRLFWELCWPML